MSSERNGDIGENLQTRLDELKAEHERGQQMLQQAEAEANELRAQLLRISGAIQVLEELIDPDSAPSP